MTEMITAEEARVQLYRIAHDETARDKVLAFINQRPALSARSEQEPVAWLRRDTLDKLADADESMLGIQSLVGAYETKWNTVPVYAAPVSHITPSAMSDAPGHDRWYAVHDALCGAYHSQTGRTFSEDGISSSGLVNAMLDAYGPPETRKLNVTQYRIMMSVGDDWHEFIPWTDVRDRLPSSNSNLVRVETRSLYAGEPGLEAEVERLNAKVSNLTQLLDAQLGTPCEQIRHQQEVDELRALLAEAREALGPFAAYYGEHAKRAAKPRSTMPMSGPMFSLSMAADQDPIDITAEDFAKAASLHAKLGAE